MLSSLRVKLDLYHDMIYCSASHIRSRGRASQEHSASGGGIVRLVTVVQQMGYHLWHRLHISDSVCPSEQGMSRFCAVLSGTCASHLLESSCAA